MNTNEFGIEVDFLPVGDGSRSADAIAIRYGDLISGDRSKQKVVIIDGGTKESGKALVDHLFYRYLTTEVDLVIMTHPDRDHASGLTEVLNGLTVHQLWMHQPWNHSADIRQHFVDGRITDSSLERRLRVSMDAAHEVEQIAIENGIKITEPFAGTRSADGVITVLGPTKDYYQSLLPEFSKTPESVASKAFGFLGKAIEFISETFDSEHLPGGETSAENNSSSVLLFQLPGSGLKLLIVGDAGVPALEKVTIYAANQGIRLTDLEFMQVPHHGSKKNVNTDILNKIRAKIGFISAAKEGAPKHPSQRVINALVRRGTRVVATQGESICYNHYTLARSGWSAAPILSFIHNYEE